MSQVVFVRLCWWQGSWNDWGLERNWNMAQMYTEGCSYLTRAPCVLILAQMDVQWSWNDWGLKRRLLSTLFTITSLILGLQSWIFCTIWAPVVVTSGMNFSMLLPLLSELSSLMCVFEKCAKFAHKWPQWTHWCTIGWEIWNLMVDASLAGNAPNGAKNVKFLKI